MCMLISWACVAIVRPIAVHWESTKTLRKKYNQWPYWISAGIVCNQGLEPTRLQAFAVRPRIRLGASQRSVDHTDPRYYLLWRPPCELRMLRGVGKGRNRTPTSQPTLHLLDLKDMCVCFPQTCEAYWGCYLPRKKLLKGSSRRGRKGWSAEKIKSGEKYVR